jgi:short-subunit dehydrogenase
MKRILKGSRVLITGASRGVGRCLAGQAVEGGARVLLVGRTAARLEELAGSLSRVRGAEAYPVPGDITVADDRTRMLRAAAERLGGLDVLVNNAAIASFGHFATSSEDVLRQVMETNFFAPAELIREAIPLLTKGRRPAVVNVASFIGRMGMPAWSEYCASKFALCGLTEALRGELARFGIDALLILPGRTQSPGGRQLLRYEGRMNRDYTKGMPPADVARGILRALYRNRTETVLGWDARLFLIAHRWLPGLVHRLIARYVRKLYKSEPGSRGGLVQASGTAGQAGVLVEGGKEER